MSARLHGLSYLPEHHTPIPPSTAHCGLCTADVLRSDFADHLESHALTRPRTA